MIRKNDTVNEYLIRNCSIAYECKTKWEDLPNDGISGLRFCEACKKEVHLCVTASDLMESMRRDHCVAIEISGDKKKMFMGLLRPDSQF